MTLGRLNECVCVCVILPLIRVMVQFLLTSEGRWANSKAKGPALGFRSPSSAVMLMALGSGFSHISASGGDTLGALSLISNRWICRVPVPLAGGVPRRVMR